MDVDDEDLLAPDDLIVSSVIGFIGYNDVQQDPAVVQQQAEHEEEPPDTKTARSWLRLEVLLNITKSRFDGPTFGRVAKSSRVQ